MGELIALLLADQDVARQALACSGKPSEHLVQELSRPDDVGCDPLEQIEELPVAPAQQVPDRWHIARPAEPPRRHRATSEGADVKSL